MRVAAAGLAITAAASISSGWFRIMKGAVTGLGMVMVAALLMELTGCSHPVAVGYSIPSVVPVSAALSTTRGEIERTRVAISKASGSAARLAISAAERHELQSYISEAAASVQAADNAASLTLTNLGTFNSSVTNQTAVLNTTSARLDYIEPKYQHSVALLWKWRLIALGVIGAIVAFLILKYGSRLVATAAALAARVP
jgi:hypothetical protein